MTRSKAMISVGSIVLGLLLYTLICSMPLASSGSIAVAEGGSAFICFGGLQLLTGMKDRNDGK